MRCGNCNRVDDCGLIWSNHPNPMLSWGHLAGFKIKFLIISLNSQSQIRSGFLSDYPILRKNLYPRYKNVRDIPNIKNPESRGQKSRIPGIQILVPGFSEFCSREFFGIFSRFSYLDPDPRNFGIFGIFHSGDPEKIPS